MSLLDPVDEVKLVAEAEKKLKPLLENTVQSLLEEFEDLLKRKKIVITFEDR